MLTISNVPGNPKPKRRSGCSVSISLETFGDRWSLIVRDRMVRGFRTFKEFQESGEGIATNILADRLQKLDTDWGRGCWSQFGTNPTEVPTLLTELFVAPRREAQERTEG